MFDCPPWLTAGCLSPARSAVVHKMLQADNRSKGDDGGQLWVAGHPGVDRSLMNTIQEGAGTCLLTSGGHQLKPQNDCHSYLDSNQVG